MKQRIILFSKLLEAKLKLMICFASEKEEETTTLSIVNNNYFESPLYRKEGKAKSLDDCKKRAIRKAASVFSPSALRFKLYSKSESLCSDDLRVYTHYQSDEGYYLSITFNNGRFWNKVYERKKETNFSKKEIESLVRKHTGKTIKWKR